MGEAVSRTIIISTSNLPFNGILHRQLRSKKFGELSLINYGELIGTSGRQVTRYENVHHGLHNDDQQIPTLRPFKQMVLALQVDPMLLLGLHEIDAELIITKQINVDQFDVNTELIFENQFCRHCGSLIGKRKK